MGNQVNIDSMLIKLRFNRNNFSTAILAVFTATLVVTALVTEFFRAPLKTDNISTEYTSLFKPGELNQIKKLVFKNGLGEVTLQKDNSGWNIAHPRSLEANTQTVAKIIKNIEGIKIKRIFSKDPINISNYSLNPPLISVKLTNTSGETFQIDHGLIDSITSSTYINHSDKDYIYQTALLEDSFERYDLSSFINSRVLTLASSDISELKIYRTQKGKKQILVLGIKKDEGNWLGLKTGRSLSSEKVEYYLSHLSALKSNLIMDQLTEKLEKGLNKLIDNPRFSIVIKDQIGKEYKYTVTWLIYSLPGLNIDKRQNFAIEASNKKYPFLIPKGQMKLFVLNEYNLLSSSKNKLSF